MNDTPTGQLFSQIYLRRPDLLQDSVRMRNRLAMLYASYNLDDLGSLIEKELGIQLGGYEYDYQWPAIMKKLELRDVLDSITLRYRSITYDNSHDPDQHRKAYLKQASRILAEEQVRYRIDNKGGVHFVVDAEFENARISTIARLGGQRYKAARAQFEDAYIALDRIPPDGKGAIRHAFFAVEGLFRLMFPNAHQLSGSELQKHLKPHVDGFYKDEKPAIYLAQKQVAAFSDWIDGAHFYQHEPGSEEPAQPPLSLAVYMVAQAGAHLRWLAELDKK